MSQTVNKFKSSSIGGTFNNVDLPNSDELSFAYFQRNVQIGGDLDISGNIINAGLTNALNSKVSIDGSGYIINTELENALNSKVSMDTSGNIINSILDDQLASKASIVYVDDKISQLVDTSPETLNTLNELANALGDDPNFATTVSNNIGMKCDTIYVNDKLLLKADKSQISNVDNTSDTNKPVSTAQLNAINLKADKNNPTFTGTANIPNSIVSTINCDNQIYFYRGNVATPSSRIHIPTSNWIVWDNPLVTLIEYRWGVSNTVKQTLYANGNVSITGNILDCPTINTINSTLNIINSTLLLKDDVTSVNSKLLLKDDVTSVNSKLLLKDDVTSVDNKLLLKSDLTYVDDEILNLQNQINNIEGNYNPSSDVSFQNLTVSGTITNTNLTNLIDTKADKNNTVLTGLSVIPTSNTHTIYCNGQIYFHGGDLANPASRIHIGSNQLMVWDNVFNEQIVYRWGPTDSVKQIFYMNGDVSIPGNILNCSTITNINNSVALKADKTYTDNQLLLKADKTYTDTQLLLKADKTYTDTQLALKANQSSISNINNTSDANKPVSTAQQTALDLKLNKTGDTLTNVTINGTNYLNSILYTQPDKGLYFYLPANGIANHSSRLVLAGYDAMVWDNPTATDIRFRWGATNIQRHTFSSNGALAIAGNFAGVNGDFSGTLSSPTITTINNSVALKADKTYTDTQLALKTDKTYTDTQLALKTDKTYTDSQLLLKADKNNATFTGTANIPNSIVSTINCDNQIYFYRGNVATPSSRIHIPTSNWIVWDNPLVTQIDYRWGVSNTVKQTLYANGDMSISGSILNCPTITGINSSLALKESTTSVNAKLALKEDTTTVNTKLANYALLNSSPTFTGNVKSQIYTGGIVRNNANSLITFTASTLPSTIMHDGPIGNYVIPTMPLGTRFTLIRSSAGIITLTTSSTSVYFFNRNLSTSYSGSKQNLTNSLNVYEDSRTFILCEIYRSGSPVQVWMTESSHTYNLIERVVPNMIGAFMLDGANYGTTNTSIYRPICCSNKQFGTANSDDGYIVNEGFTLIIFTGANYTGTSYTLDNYFVNEEPKAVHFNSPSLNNMESCKLYYNLIEVVIPGISN